MPDTSSATTQGEGAPPQQSDAVASEATAATATTATPPATPLSPYEQLLATVPEDLRAADALKSIKDFPSLVKSYVNAQALVGRKGVLVPTEGPDTNPEAWAELYNAAGRPPSPDKYELPADHKLDKEFETEIRDVMHKWGVPQRAAFELVNWYNGKQAAYDSDYQQQLKDAAAANDALLLKTYGTAERVNQARAAADRVAAMFAPDSMRDEFKKLDIAYSPHHVILLNAIAQRLAEDKMFGINTNAGVPAMTPEDAQRRISTLRNDPQFAKSIADPSDADHARNAATWAELHKAVGNASAHLVTIPQQLATS